MTAADVTALLRAEGGHLVHVAARLGVSRWTVIRKLRELHLQHLPAELRAAAKRRFRLPPLESAP